jgi:hypothetical protein
MGCPTIECFAFAAVCKCLPFAASVASRGFALVSSREHDGYRCNVLHKDMNGI